MAGFAHQRYVRSRPSALLRIPRSYLRLSYIRRFVGAILSGNRHRLSRLSAQGAAKRHRIQFEEQAATLTRHRAGLVRT